MHKAQEKAKEASFHLRFQTRGIDFYIDLCKNLTYNLPAKIIYNLKRIRMSKYRVFYWKEIPASIVVEGEGRTVKKQLSQKVQNKIDAYAMVVGLTSTEDYSAQYKRGAWVEREGTPEDVAEALLAELELEASKVEIPKKK